MFLNYYTLNTDLGFCLGAAVDQTRYIEKHSEYKYCGKSARGVNKHVLDRWSSAVHKALKKLVTGSEESANRKSGEDDRERNTERAAKPQGGKAPKVCADKRPEYKELGKMSRLTDKMF